MSLEAKTTRGLTADETASIVLAIAPDCTMYNGKVIHVMQRGEGGMYAFMSALEAFKNLCIHDIITEIKLEASNSPHGTVKIMGIPA